MGKEKYIIIFEDEYTKYKPNPAIICGLIRSLSKKRGYCFISNEEIAKIFNVEISTIKRHLKTLKINKLIKIEGHHPRKIIPIFNFNSEKPAEKGQFCADNKGRNAPLTGANLHHNNKNNSNSYNNTSTQESSYNLKELMIIE